MPRHMDSRINRIRTRTRLSWVERWTRFKIHVWVCFLALVLLAWAFAQWELRRLRDWQRLPQKKVRPICRVWDYERRTLNENR